jgi:apolipoprotein N-acyltransferase
MRLSSKIYWDLLATLAGVLYSLAFAPFDVPYLMLVSLVLLFVSWQNTTPLQAFYRGYLFGLAAFGLGVSWVYVSIHNFGGVDSVSSGLLTTLFVAFWAIFPALAAYLSVKIRLINPRLNVISIVPMVWVLVEYLRGYCVLNGFPWLQVAYSQLETPFAGYIPVLGVYGVSFLVALTAVLLLSIAQVKKHRGVMIAMLLGLWLTGAGLKTINWTAAMGDPIRVSLIQGNVSQDQKWRPENLLTTLNFYKTMTEAHWDSKVIVWPETAIPAYLSEVNDWYLQPLSQAAKEHGSDLIVSLPLRGDVVHERYNAVMTLGKDIATYRKIHLLPFGEYLPWQPVSGFVLDSLGLALGNFTPGAIDQALLKAGGYAFITSICYEDVFGSATVKNLIDAAYLVNVTNDGWFGHSIEPQQHLQMARMRALETGRYLLRATNTGVTAIVAPDGLVIKQAPPFEATVLTGEIIPMTGVTPFTRLGDPVIIALLALWLFILIYRGYILDK